jgi:hypothetical protein
MAGTVLIRSHPVAGDQYDPMLVPWTKEDTTHEWGGIERKLQKAGEKAGSAHRERLDRGEETKSVPRGPIDITV